MFQLFSYVRKDEIKIPLRRCKPLCNQIIVRVTFNCKNSDSKKKKNSDSIYTVLFPCHWL